MATVAAQWPIGWIIPNHNEWLATLPLLNNCCVNQKIGSDDDFYWAAGNMHGKIIILVNAEKAWYASAAAAMKKELDVKVIFIGGTCLADHFVMPLIGHCILSLPEVNESHYEHLAASIPGEAIISLAKLVNAKDRFLAGSSTGHINLDVVIQQWAVQNADVANALFMPDPTTHCTFLRCFPPPRSEEDFTLQRMVLTQTHTDVIPQYAGWSACVNNHMCCGKDLNSGKLKTSIPCLQVYGVRGYKGQAEDFAEWRKYATLASAAAITSIISNINLDQ